jgi:hypothetical protein
MQKSMAPMLTADSLTRLMICLLAVFVVLPVPGARCYAATAIAPPLASPCNNRKKAYAGQRGAAISIADNVPKA